MNEVGQISRVESNLDLMTYRGLAVTHAWVETESVDEGLPSLGAIDDISYPI